MNDPNSILSMTRHAGFVWSSYAVAAAVLAGIVVATVRGLRRAKADLDAAEASLVNRDGEDDEA